MLDLSATGSSIILKICLKSRRVYEHKKNLIEGFTSKYQVHQLVYYETASEVTAALQREKQLKKWKRAWKIELIEKK